MADCYVGEIRMTASPLVPRGWARCDGQILQVRDYQLLFTLIGAVYGGDGVNTFALPDMRGRTPVSIGASKYGSNYVLGQTGGTETVTLVSGNLPAHTHAVNVSSTAQTADAPTNAVWGATSLAQFGTPGTLVQMNPGATGPAGGTAQGGVAPHDNVMPFMTLSFIIALNGIFPDFD